MLNIEKPMWISLLLLFIFIDIAIVREKRIHLGDTIIDCSLQHENQMALGQFYSAIIKGENVNYFFISQCGNIFLESFL